jgi:hypothetical protein
MHALDLAACPLRFVVVGLSRGGLSTLPGRPPKTQQRQRGGLFDITVDDEDMATSREVSWRRCSFVDLLAQVLLRGSLGAPLSQVLLPGSPGAGAYLWLYHACSASRSGDLGAGASVRISCGSLGTGASSGTSWRRCFFVDLLAQVLL